MEGTEDHPEAESYPWPTASKKMATLVLQPQKPKSSNSMNEFGA